jgi:hypothetical protein
MSNEPRTPGNPDAIADPQDEKILDLPVPEQKHNDANVKGGAAISDASPPPPPPRARAL